MLKLYKVKAVPTVACVQSSRDGIRFDMFGCLSCNSVEVRISPDCRLSPVDRLSDLIKFEIFFTDV